MFITATSQAQIVSTVPSNTPHNRFTEEILMGMERPGLSVIGFDNGGNNQYGYGLKQILNIAYSTSSNPTKDIIKSILQLSNNNLLSPTSDGVIENNSNYLQYKAFETLASYVLEHNGIDSTTSNNTYNIPIRTHTVAINDFTQSIMSVVNNLTGSEDDFVKDVRSFANIARAIDLYLALENAYKEWDFSEWNNANSTILLSEQEKTTLMQQYGEDIRNFYNDRLNNTEGYLANLFDVQEDEVEPGNRPLKGHLAVGYGIMAVQAIYSPSYNYHSVLSEAEDRAYNFPSESQNRYYLWTYQTDAGNRYWAEGPYYLSYVLPDAIQFWHAVRARKLGGASDAFNSSWFLNPIKWLADISTPDGFIPPIDDGNKFGIKGANLLRWSNEYGDSEVGKKYNSIYKKTKQYHSAGYFGSHRYLLELAIPKRSSSDFTNIDYDSPQPNTAQQLIARHTNGAGNMHYVYLNTESGNAIKRGEGHEQPDQLQLLYYVDEYSYLVDSGYDRGSPEDNSFRNGYKYHNTMQYDNGIRKTFEGYLTYQNSGGIESPYVSIGKARKVSNHYSVTDKQLSNPSSKVKLLKAGVDLYYEKKDDDKATYDRKVIFIEDQNPFIIDINRVEANSSKNNFVMRYHGNGSQISTANGWSEWSNTIDGASKKLYNYTVSIENSGAESFSESTYPLDILEYENNDGSGKNPYSIQVKELEFDKNDNSFETIGFLKVSGSAPNYTPKSKLITGGKYVYLKQSSNVVDVVVSRFGDIDFKFNFNINDDIDIPSLSLDSGEKYGYARLVKNSSGWEIDNNYQINLERSAPTASVSGPGILFEGQEGTWQASASGGVPPYSYTWFLQPQGSSSPSPIGTGSSISYTARDPFYISVEAEDANSKTDHSPAHYVKITGFHHKKLADSAKVPDEFLANPNYPNPFNPTTTIKYGVPEQANVTLNVYNILGQNVATLVNETKAAGYYSVRFDASSLASGFYIARITAEGVSGEHFVDEQKMQLIK